MSTIPFTLKAYVQQPQVELYTETCGWVPVVSVISAWEQDGVNLAEVELPVGIYHTVQAGELRIRREDATELPPLRLIDVVPLLAVVVSFFLGYIISAVASSLGGAL